MGSEQGLRPGSKNIYVMSPPAPAPKQILHVKEEDFTVVEEVFGSDAEQSPSVNASYNVLKSVMKYVCLIYDNLLQEPWKALKQSGEEIFERFQSAICNPPYNLSLIMELPNSGLRMLILKE